MSSEAQALSTFCFATRNECLLSSVRVASQSNRASGAPGITFTFQARRRTWEGQKARARPGRLFKEFPIHYLPFVSSWPLVSVREAGKYSFYLGTLSLPTLQGFVRKEEERRGITDSTRSVCHSHGSTNCRWESQVWGSRCIMWVFSQFLVS